MCLSIRQQIIIYLGRVVVQTCMCVSKCFHLGKCVTAPFFGHLVVIKCEYKAEMKCTWTAESSRMKRSMQLGLLCVSLFILCLHGEEEVETDTSMQMPIIFDEPELHQFEVRDKLCCKYFYWGQSHWGKNAFKKHLFLAWISLNINLFIDFFAKWQIALVA